MPDALVWIAFATVGMVVGSFLNVCIYRLPIGESIAWPGSHCPACKTPVKWYDNVPVLGWLALGAKCRSCKTPISIVYPIVEAATGGLFLLEYWLIGPGQPLLLFSRILFGCAMIVLFMIDLQHRILPNVITLPGIAIGFVFSLVQPPGWASSLIGIVAGGGGLWATAEIYYRVRGEEGLGFGDVKMIAMIGAFLGWQLMLLTLFLSSFVGSIVGVGMVVLRKGDMKYALPFGTFLSVAAVISAAVGERIVTWYAALFP